MNEKERKKGHELLEKIELSEKYYDRYPPSFPAVKSSVSASPGPWPPSPT
jgi:hypothetical protein